MNKTIRQQATIASGIMISTLLIACGSNQANHQTVLDSTETGKHQASITPVKPPEKPEVLVIQSGASKEAEAIMSISPATNHAIEQVTRQRIATEKRKQLREHSAKQELRPSRLMDYTHTPAYHATQTLTQRYQNIQDGEHYAHYQSNHVIQTLREPVSTFSIDVDTGSYSNMRRLIQSGHLPVKDAIRTEELINYFNYEIPANQDLQAPFAIHTEVGPSPWSNGRHLLKIGIKAVDVEQHKLPAANLTFLIDVSGSMKSEKKLGLLKKSLALLVSKLRPQDSIAMVVYAGASGVVLEPTAGNHKQQIIRALDSLSAGGSTNGASGIRLAYQVAQQAYIKDGINRILLSTDGDFNVGTVNFEQLKNLVEEKRKTGITLSTIGFGTGNYNDHLMEQLADAANGQYSYIDNLNEAQKVLVDEMSSSLKTVAKDTKIQVEFNPDIISEYRLIGYENRLLNKEDFNNDKVDAGDIGAGHSVTALYEIVLKNSQATQIDELRYQHPTNSISDNETNNELAFVKVRYKNPQETQSQLVKHIVSSDQIKNSLNANSKDFRFSASVAAFAELLKGGQHQQGFDFIKLIRLANSAKGDDPFGYRNEFIQLIRLAETLKTGTITTHLQH